MKTISIKLPDIGEGVTEAELVEWYVKVGDLVREDDVLADVMTDKATVEIPAICDGKITWIGGEVGEILAVGSELVKIETAEAAVTEVPKEKSPEPVKKVELKKEVKAPVAMPEKAQVSAPRSKGKKPLAAPAVRERAKEAGLDLYKVSGTGQEGQITHADVDALLVSGGSGRAKNTSVNDIKIVGLRRKIADRMATANTRIPHVTIIEEVDVTEIEALRAKLNVDRGEKAKLTVLPFILSALCGAVREYPEMNAIFDDEAGVVTRFGGVQIGIATATKKGLIVPVVRHVEARSVWDIAAEIARLSEAAREGDIKREELTGSTITVTSLGPLGALATTPIINHPEVAIVGVNKMVMRPMWNGTEFVPRMMMNLSCSFDHRVIDGWEAAVFVQKLKSLLETPALIFMND
ncbi:MAG: 2-oxo acid dehydrogenase subunit E2 [Rhizobiaceae bacterium]|nr:2-oxo acid dehydrogenase subunit E2 [Rhizobiaceae bacterium]